MDTNRSNRTSGNFWSYFVVSIFFVLMLKNVASLVRVGTLFLSGQAASAPSGSIGLLVLAIDELINLSWHALLVFLLVFKHDRLRANWLADATLLVLGVDTPVFNLIAAMTLPGFMQQKNYTIFYAFHCAMAGIVLPPAHMLMHWVLSGPVYM